MELFQSTESVRREFVEISDDGGLKVVWYTTASSRCAGDDGGGGTGDPSRNMRSLLYGNRNCTGNDSSIENIDDRGGWVTSSAMGASDRRWPSEDAANDEYSGGVDDHVRTEAVGDGIGATIPSLT